MNKNIFFAMAMLLVTINACRNTANHEHEPSHAPGDGLEPLQYTLYTDSLELFVEFKPLVKGRQTKFASHLSVLRSEFKPLTEGKVRVSLQINGQTLTSGTDSFSTPGIFPLTLQPTTAGTGKLVFDITTKNFNDQIVIDSIRVFTDEAAARKNLNPEGHNSDISFSKEQAWNIPFATEIIHKKDFSGVIHTSGQVLSTPDNEVVLSASSHGIVRFSGNPLSTGSKVNAGTLLFTIKPAGLQQGSIDAGYIQAKNKMAEAKRNYERAAELVEDKIIAEKDYLDAKLIYDNAQAEVQMLSKQRSQTSQNCSSPVSGYIKNILVSEGQFVSAGTPLATLLKNQKVLLQANVSQKHIRILPNIRSANFRIQGDPYNYQTEAFNGKVVSYGKTATEGLIPLLFEVDYDIRFMPGSSLELFLLTNSQIPCIVVPETAIMEEQGTFYVYVQTGGEMFQKRIVRIGESNGQQVQILSGLEEGERVVTKGAFQIKLSVASGSMPAHGHEH